MSTVKIEVFVREMHQQAFQAMVTERYQPHMVRIIGVRTYPGQSTYPSKMVKIEVCDAEFLWGVAETWSETKAGLLP